MLPKIVLLVVLTHFTFGLASAQRTQATLTPFSSEQVGVSVYNEQLHGVTFGPVFRDSGLKPIALVLTNSAEHAIVALQVRWDWVGLDGKPGSLNQHSDSFGNGMFIAASRSQVLIVPGAAPINMGNPARAGAIAGVPAQLRTATRVVVALDAVILADGQVIGPNIQNLTGLLEAKDMAAKMLAQIVADAKGRGADPLAAIEKAIQEAPAKSHLRVHLSDLYQRVARGASIPRPRLPLPRFYRK
jgi:hypothetical protein